MYRYKESITPTKKYSQIDKNTILSWRKWIEIKQTHPRKPSQLDDRALREAIKNPDILSGFFVFDALGITPVVPHIPYADSIIVILGTSCSLCVHNKK